MEVTALLCKVIGPVLLVRALSILIDRRHFDAMVAGLDREVATITFSFFPIALLMACLGVLAVHEDTTTLAGLTVWAMALGGALKATALILFPAAVAAKVGLLVRAGFLNVVLAVCLGVGGYFTWFGWVAHR